MSCQIADEIIREYPRQFDLLFISTSGETIPNDLTGFMAEIEKVANATPTPEVKKMKAVRSYKDLKQKPIYVESIEFFPYDTTRNGGAGQDPDVNAEIIGSRTGTDIYPQSLYRNAMMPLNWQPNFFNFTFLVNGSQLVEGLDNGFDLSIADLTIGQPMPYCIQVCHKVDRLQSIDLSSRFAQYIAGEEKYQNYPLLAKLSIRVKDGY